MPQKYATHDPYRNMPFAIEDEPKADKVTWVIWVCAVALLLTGIIAI